MSIYKQRFHLSLPKLFLIDEIHQNKIEEMGDFGQKNHN